MFKAINIKAKILHFTHLHVIVWPRIAIVKKFKADLMGNMFITDPS